MMEFDFERVKDKKARMNTAAIIVVGIVVIGYYLSLVHMGVIDHDSWSGIVGVREGKPAYQFNVSRIGWTFTGLLGILQTYQHSIWGFRVFTCFGTTLSVLIWSRLSSKINGNTKGFAIVYFLLFFLLAQYNGEHNGLWAFGWVYQVSMFFFGFSLYQYYQWLENQNQKRYLIYSLVAYLLAMMAYELYVPLGILFFLLELYCLKKNRELISVSTMTRRIISHFMIAVLYTVTWMIPQFLFPQINTGDATVSYPASIRKVLSTLVSFAFAMFPLRYNGYLPSEIWQTLRKIQGEDVLPILILLSIVVLCLVQLHKCYKISRGTFWFISLFSVIGALVTNVLLAFNGKFQAWHALGVKGYGTSYHAYFFIILWICCLVVYLYQKTVGRGFLRMICLGVYFIVFGMIAVITFLNNKNFMEDHHKEFVRIMMFEQFLDTDVAADIKDDAQVYMPQFNGLHEDMDSLGEYAKETRGITFQTLNEKEKLDISRDIYYYIWDYDNDALYFAKMMDDTHSDEVFILSDQELKNKNVNFRRSGDNLDVYIANVNMGVYGDDYVVTPSLSIDLNGESIYADGIIPESLHLTGDEMACNMLVQWSDYGFNFQTMGRYAAPDTTLYINNYKGYDTCKFQIEYQLLGAGGATYEISGGDYEETFELSPAGSMEIELPLSSGDNRFFIHSDMGGIEGEEDRKYSLFVTDAYYWYGGNQFDLTIVEDW